jgi:hypothetical protein
MSNVVPHGPHDSSEHFWPETVTSGDSDVMPRVEPNRRWSPEVSREMPLGHDTRGTAAWERR